MTEQVVLEYGGVSESRGGGPVVFVRAGAYAPPGGPPAQPRPFVTNAVEEIALSLTSSLSLDVTQGQLYQYSPWDAVVRRERTLLVTFRGDAWSMPVWADADETDEFLGAALADVHAIRPYALSAMHLEVI